MYIFWLQGIQGTSLCSELENEAGGKVPHKYVLMCKGPFCTPRSVIKNMTIKSRPKLDEIADCMKSLSGEKIGEFKQLTHKERAYYKPLPEEDNKAAIVSIVGTANWDEYVCNFKSCDLKYITPTQHNRLLQNSPHLELMETYGIAIRET